LYAPKKIGKLYYFILIKLLREKVILLFPKKGRGQRQRAATSSGHPKTRKTLDEYKKVMKKIMNINNNNNPPQQQLFE
jgi:hypothetical protein